MNAGEIAKRLLENKWALTFGEQAALASSYQEAEKALRDVLDVAIWMSGSPSFGPEGEAHEGWVKARPKLDAAAAFLAEQEKGKPGGRDYDDGMMTDDEKLLMKALRRYFDNKYFNDEQILDLCRQMLKSFKAEQEKL